MKKMEWFKKFWGTHGERFVYGICALSLAKAMYMVGLDKEANVILIATATLCVNKMRSTNRQTKGE